MDLRNISGITLFKRLHYSTKIFFIFWMMTSQLVILSQKSSNPEFSSIKFQIEDSLKVKAYENIGDRYNTQKNLDSAIFYYEKGYELANKISYMNGVGRNAYSLGNIFLDKQKNDRAIFFYLKAISAWDNINYQNGLGDCYTNLGLAYQNQSNFPKSFIYYFKSLRIKTILNDKEGIGNNYFNIASVYDELGETDNALEYYFKSISVFKQTDSLNLAGAYLNIGLVYLHQQNFLKAVQFYFKALEIATTMNDKPTLTLCYFNLGSLYDDIGQLNKSLEYYNKSLSIDEEAGDEIGITKCFINIAEIYSRQSNYNKANLFYKQALKIALKNEDIRELIEIYEGLSTAAQHNKNFKAAYEFHCKFKELNDSIFNLENSKQLGEARTTFEVEQKETELRAKQYQQEKIYNTQQIKKELEIKNQKLARNGFIAGTVFSLLLAFFAYRNLKLSRKANKVIALQKEYSEKQRQLIEVKQKEIIESITYAKNLQTAILPSNNFLEKHIPQNFIFYRPKDIVAGDFYWAEKVGDVFFIAVADSTGHGVPGAMVSVVCSNALNSAIKEFKLKAPGKILDKTRELILQTFEKSTNDVKDGMDISLLCIDDKRQNILWAGANNPLWYSNDKTIVEIRGDKQPIGKTENATPFTTHKIEYSAGMIFYLFTDGFMDQFGGSFIRNNATNFFGEGKKYKKKKFLRLISDCFSLPLPQQSTIIINSFDEWKGTLEQVDDVCVLGVKL